MKKLLFQILFTCLSTLAISQSNDLKVYNFSGCHVYVTAHLKDFAQGANCAPSNTAWVGVPANGGTHTFATTPNPTELYTAAGITEKGGVYSSEVGISTNCGTWAQSFTAQSTNCGVLNSFYTNNGYLIIYN